jgi:hypothetical protein
MDNGMITLHNNDDMRPRRNHNIIKIKKVMPWEMRQGHQEHRDTVFDNRPKRQRTRSAQKRRACEDHGY